MPVASCQQDDGRGWGSSGNWHQCLRERLERDGPLHNDQGAGREGNSAAMELPDEKVGASQR
jgi:hypothetical protein